MQHMDSVFICIYFVIKVWHISSEGQEFLPGCAKSDAPRTITNEIFSVPKHCSRCDTRLRSGCQNISTLTSITRKLCVKHYWKDWALWPNLVSPLQIMKQDDGILQSSYTRGDQPMAHRTDAANSISSHGLLQKPVLYSSQCCSRKTAT